MRTLLLRASRSTWLRRRAVVSPVVRRSVSRFMPGERLDDALAAAQALGAKRIGTILTYLGENLKTFEEAERVTRHYLEVLDRIQAAGLDAQISVKPTQLGLDLDRARCLENLLQLVRRAGACGNFVWIDMERSTYVDATLDLYRAARAESVRVGVCLQSYLRRSAADLELLLPLRPAIRLVKGAYQETPQVAFARKRDVDQSFTTLATRFLTAEERRGGGLLGIATHDQRLLQSLRDVAERGGVPTQAYEFEMLYGIARARQDELARDGRRLRVLISYGEYWFPWYMRRLAERPANLLFVLKSLGAR